MTRPMTRLSDTQRIILVAAAQRDDRTLLPLPATLRGGAAAKAVGALLKRGLVAEVAVDDGSSTDMATGQAWRTDADGRPLRLYVTDAGLAAIGVEPEGADSARVEATVAEHPDTVAEGPTETTKPAERRTPRPGTKQALLIDMLRADGGATLAEIVAATGWQPHTVRGAISGALKKRMGLPVASERVDGRGRVYSLPPI